MRLGDWSKVVALIEQGVGDDDILKEAYNQMGQFCIDKQRWNKAALYFQQANNFDALIDVYYRLEQFDNIDKLIDNIPENSSSLITLAEKMQSVGICESAVKAYIKSGDVKKAIDCCVLLNQWNQAVELAEQHNFLAIEQLLARYAQHLIQKDKKMEAVELYRKANKNTESAKLLAEIAQKLQEQRAPPLMIKKIYVLAAFEIDSYKQRVFDASMTQLTGTNTADATAKTLNSLITTDINNSANKALSNPWKGAEAIHFYLLCQRQLYQKEYSRSMKTAIRLIEYEKELDAREVYSLIALSAYYNKCYKECSKAFVKLERLPNVSKIENKKFESIALALFSRHAPTDAPQVKFPCPKKSCDAQISEYDTNCQRCGSFFSACAASGKSILSKDYYTCKTCKHKALYKELDYLRLKHFPLCHTPIEPYTNK